jgi:hypothetical protein
MVPLNPFRKSVRGKNSSQRQGWDVVDKYISGQKGYDEIEDVRGEGEKTGIMPMAVISEEKAKTHKTWIIALSEACFLLLLFYRSSTDIFFLCLLSTARSENQVNPRRNRHVSRISI